MTTIEREKECPFLLRIFTQFGGHHKPHEYSIDSVPEKDENRVYTWRDATLEELAGLIKDISDEANRPDARIVFRLVYWDVERSRFAHQDLGRVMNAEETKSQSKTLEDCKFVIGDYLDVAIFDGAPPPRPPRASGGPDRFDRDGRPGRFGHGRDRQFGGDRDVRSRYRDNRF